MKAASPRVSFADLEQWPEDGCRYELYDGEVFEIPAPILLHQFVLGRLHLVDGRLSLRSVARGGERVDSPLLPALDLRSSDLVPASSH